ncbi:MAG: hypothetical protein K1X79_13845 [Oligoflexia bacterium]|nr:hypothetical protein [Oligoflexia bacterium]
MARTIILTVFIIICVLLLAPYLGLAGRAEEAQTAVPTRATAGSTAPAAQGTPAKSLSEVERML